MPNASAQGTCQKEGFLRMFEKWDKRLAKCDAVSWTGLKNSLSMSLIPLGVNNWEMQ